MRPDEHQRYWAKVNVTDGCWLWTAGVGQTGYGRFKRNHGVFQSAHRYSWEFHYGPILNSLHVLHRCDTPACVRPDHLHLGTPADNRREMVERGRERHANGESHGRAKLTKPQVLEIRSKYETGECSYNSLGQEYGVSKRMVGYIVQRKNWQYVG